MTFNPSLYTGVVINEFASVGAATYDASGTFDVTLPYRTSNLSKWAGKTAYALKIESSYPVHLITDEGVYGPAPQGFLLDETYLAADGASFLYLFEAPSTLHVDSPFDPNPMVFNQFVQYAVDPEFRFPDYPGPRVDLWPYVYYLVLTTPTTMPSLAVLEASVLTYHQHIFVFDFMTPDATLADGSDRWALRLTVYVDDVPPEPLRMFQRDDDVGKAASARLGGHAPVGNPPSSLQRQTAPRLVEGGNVYL